MADRYFRREQYSNVVNATTLFCIVSIGATGAPTLDTNTKVGIASIARSAQGTYLLTLQDQFYKLLAFRGTHLKATAADIVFQVSAEDVDGAKTLTFFTNTAGTATDPASGDKLLLEIVVQNSSVPA